MSKTLEQHRAAIKTARKARRNGWQCSKHDLALPQRDDDGKLPTVRISFSLNQKEDK